MRLLILLLLTASLTGCVDPYKIAVDADVLDSSPRDWSESRGKVSKLSLIGPRIQSVEYEHQGNFPGFLSIIAIRSLNRLDEQELLDKANEVLNAELEDQGITNLRTLQSGNRELGNGVSTSFKVIEGSSQGTGLFAEGQSIRVLSEAAYDSKSNTHVVAVGLAQVSRTTVLGTTTNTDTWLDIVGDPSGSVSQLKTNNGFMFNLQTH